MPKLLAKRTTFPATPGMIIGVAAVSTASTFIRLAQESASSLTIAAWRLMLASLILAPFAFATQRSEWRSLRRRDWVCLLGAGVLLALHFYTWIVSLAMTSVAASVVLVTLNPLFVGLISHFFLNERLTRTLTLGLIVALLGSAIIGWGDLGQGVHRVQGDLFALVGALAVAGYMLIGRRQRQHLSLLGYVFPVYATAALTLFGAALLSHTPLLGFPTPVWGWLLLLAVIPQIIGHSALNWSLGKLPATYVALSVLAEPLGSTLLAWWILHESPPVTAVGGGLLILGGIAVSFRRTPAAQS